MGPDEHYSLSCNNPSNLFCMYSLRWCGIWRAVVETGLTRAARNKERATQYEMRFCVAPLFCLTPLWSINRYTPNSIFKRTRAGLWLNQPKAWSKKTWRTLKSGTKIRHVDYLCDAVCRCIVCVCGGWGSFKVTTFSLAHASKFLAAAHFKTTNEHTGLFTKKTAKTVNLCDQLKPQQ